MNFKTILADVVCFGAFRPRAENKMRILGFSRAVLYYEFLANFDLWKCFGWEQIQKLLFIGNTLLKKDNTFYCLYIIFANRRSPPGFFASFWGGGEGGIPPSPLPGVVIVIGVESMAPVSFSRWRFCN